MISPRSACCRAALLAIVAAALVSSAARVSADVVILRNGRYLDGRVVRHSETELILAVSGGEIRLPSASVEEVRLDPRTSAEKPAAESPAAELGRTAGASDAGASREPIRIDPAPAGEPKPAAEPRTDEPTGKPVAQGAGAAELEGAPALDPATVAPEIVIARMARGQWPVETVTAAFQAVVDRFRTKPRVLERMAAESRDAQERALIVRLIGAIGAPSSGSFVRNELRDGDPGVRGEALEAADRIDPEDFAADLALLAEREPDARVREKVLELCAQRKIGDAAQAAWSDLRSRDDRLADAAVAAMAALWDGLGSDALPLDLREAVAQALDEGPEAGTEARLLLLAGRIGLRNRAARIAASLEHEDARCRRAALEALRILRAGDQVPAITARWQVETDPERRFELLTALREIADPAAVPFLIRRLSDPDPAIADQANRALEAVSGQSFGPDAESWRAWWTGLMGGSARGPADEGGE